jgi:uncharacterized phage protein (TIGR01671 family)
MRGEIMRKIKFRFRLEDKKTKEILVVYTELYNLKYSSDLIQYPIDLNTYDILSIDEYIGFNDIHLKEIYERDIVQFKVKGSNKTETTVMQFNKEHGAFLFGIYNGVKMPCGKKTRMNKYTRKSVGSVEVIGNVYDNPLNC